MNKKQVDEQQKTTIRQALIELCLEYDPTEPLNNSLLDKDINSMTEEQKAKFDRFILKLRGDSQK